MASVIQGSTQANPLRPLTKQQLGLTWVGGRIPLGVDRFFTSPGRGPVYDYPNPRIPIPPLPNKTWVDPLKLNLRSQDTQFAGPGMWADYEYPNPKIPLQPLG